MMKLQQLLLSTVAFLGLGLAQAATIVTLDSNTSLSDGTTFTAGDTFLVAFQLTGSGSSNTTATVSRVNLGGGTALTSGPTDGLVSLSDPLAPWLAGSNLLLTVNGSTTFSLFTHHFVAGSVFSFETLLGSDNNPEAPYPDQFSFQLYRDGVESAPVYEVLLTPDGGSSPVPEPGTWVLMSAGLGAVALRRRFAR